MESWQRELYIARIVTGKTRIRIDHTNTLCLVSPTPDQRFIAAEIYRDARRDAELDGALTDEELLEIMIKQQIWSLKDGEDLEKFQKAVEDLKVGLFENRLKSNAKTSIRKALQKTKEEIGRLENVRFGLNHLTLDGLASSAKYRYLIGVGLRYPDGSHYWHDDSWDNADPLIDQVSEILIQERLSECQFRELARSEPWRSTWGGKNQAGRGVFGCAAVDLTDDQKNLILWSNVYDNIREYPDCPNDDIIKDDDMLDGWMIIQRRKREAQAASQQAQRIGNAKIREADEQYIFVDTIDDAREVEKMNDPAAAAIKKQRMALIKEKGEVNEVHMPDTMMKFKMEMTRLQSAHMRNKK